MGELRADLKQVKYNGVLISEELADRLLMPWEETTWAAKPAPGVAGEGFETWITDIGIGGGSPWVVSGGVYRMQRPEIILYDNKSRLALPNNNPVETIYSPRIVTVPGGLLGLTRRMRTFFEFSRDLASTSSVFRLRFNSVNNSMTGSVLVNSTTIGTTSAYSSLAGLLMNNGSESSQTVLPTNIAGDYNPSSSALSAGTRNTASDTYLIPSVFELSGVSTDQLYIERQTVRLQQ